MPNTYQSGEGNRKHESPKRHRQANTHRLHETPERARERPQGLPAC